MSSFDIFRFQFGNASAEEKLAILRSESLVPLNVIQGYSDLLIREVDNISSTEVPPELKEYSLIIKDTSRKLSEYFEALTAPHFRERYGLAELKPYDTLLDALKQTAVTLKLPLAEALENNILHTRDDYPVWIWDSGEPQHKIQIELLESQYRVRLLVSDTMGKNQIFRVVKEAKPKTLNEAIETIQRWLLDDLSDV